MKMLGSSLHGGAIIELTQSESDALKALVNAMSGHGYDWGNLAEVWKNDEPIDDVFRLIRHFARTRFCIAEFENSVDFLKRALLAVEGGSDEGATNL